MFQVMLMCCVISGADNWKNLFKYDRDTKLEVLYIETILF